jgi:hypothetical protein
MFLWVELVIGHFQYLLTDEEVLRAVHSLPASLQDALVALIKFMAVAHLQ